MRITEVFFIILMILTFVTPLLSKKQTIHIKKLTIVALVIVLLGGLLMCRWPSENFSEIHKFVFLANIISFVIISSIIILIKKRKELYILLGGGFVFIASMMVFHGNETMVSLSQTTLTLLTFFVTTKNNVAKDKIALLTASPILIALWIVISNSFVYSNPLTQGVIQSVVWVVSFFLPLSIGALVGGEIKKFRKLEAIDKTEPPEMSL